MIKPLSYSFVIFFAAAAAGGLAYASTVDTKLSPDELVTKHLESIGSAESRAKAHGTRIKGECLLTIKEGGTGQAMGSVELSSQGDMQSMKIAFEGENPMWFKFDGAKTTVSQFRPGQRTSLEAFLFDYATITREGLFGGTLSEAWPLLHLQSRNPKLEYSGMKEVDGRKLYSLRYKPKKASDLKIALFFEPETFRHVRTEYSRTIYASDQQRILSGGGQLPPPGNQRSSNARIEAVEEFSDFKTEQGLTLPHAYDFELSIQSEVRPALVDWKIKLATFEFGSPFDPSELN